MPVPQSPARPATDEYADFYGSYIAAVKEPLLDTLEAEAAQWRALLAGVPPGREGYRYAPGKWSVREVVGHVTDAERMFTVRAMAFARGDRSHFPSFDENAYAANSGADRRPLADLAEELVAVRRATVLLLLRRGDLGGASSLRGHSRHLVLADRRNRRHRGMGGRRGPLGAALRVHTCAACLASFGVDHRGL